LNDRQTFAWSIQLIIAALLIASGPGCVYAPAYNGTLCEDNGDCPPGYTCFSERCFKDDSEINLEEPNEEINLDADGGPDTGDDGGQPADDGGQPGDDGGLDDGDQGEDGGADDAGADEGPCGGCPGGYYCNEGSGTCHPCELDEHCGEDCFDCTSESKTCTEFDGNFCCLGACAFENGCQLVQCEDVGVICRSTDFVPTFEWTRDNVGLPHYCLLSDQAGPIPETYSCFDDENLRFSCPWDGLCDAGLCDDQLAERTHNCGQAWGCDPAIGACRTFFKIGTSCSFNYDCDSFCCSRDQTATCIAFDQGACKIFDTQYNENLTLYTWTAYDAQNPHDINSWGWAGGHNGPSCTHDRDCDSGHCRDFLSGGKHCGFQGCVDDPEASGIKSTYFCPSGGHSAHIDFVTNEEEDRFPASTRCD
jgi:hypothetical protein